MPHFLLAIVISVVVQEAPPSASIQTIPGVLPGFPLPIACSGDIGPIVERLRLSDAQASVLRDALGDYWDGWRNVQESEFESYAHSQVLVSSIWWRGPDRSTLSAYQARHQRIAIALQTLDQTFLDEVSKVLAAEQSGAIELERALRELEYLVADPVVQAWFPSGAPLDLREVVKSHGFEMNEAVALVLTSYESQLQRQLKRVNKGIAEARSCWVEAVRDIDRTPVDPNAPPQELMKHRDSVHAWSGCLRATSGMIRDCLRTTRDAAERIARELPPEQSRRFESIYFARQFGEPFIMWHGVEFELDAAIKLEQLDEAVRAKLVAVSSRWYGEGRQLEWTMVDGLIAKCVRLPAGMNVGMGAPSPDELPLNDALFGAEQLRLEIMKLLQTSLPREVQRAIIGQSVDTVMRPLQRLDPRANALPRLVTQRGLRTAMQPWIDAPNMSEVERIAELVREPIDELAMSAALGRVAEGYAAAKAEWISKTETPPGPPSRDSIDPVRDRMQATGNLLTRFETVDEELCVSIETTLSSPRTAALLRLARLCARVNAVREAWTRTSAGLAVDLTVALAATDDPVQVALRASMIDPTMMTTSLRNLLAACVAFHRAEEIALATRMLRPSNPAPEQWQMLEDRVRASEEAYHAARSAMETARAAFVAAQQQAIAVLVSEAAPDVRSAVLRECAAQAFPGVFSELTGAARRLKRASALRDLSAEQKTSLAEVATDLDRQIDLYLESVLPPLNAVAADVREHDDIDDAILAMRMKQLGIDQRQLAANALFSMNRILSVAQQASLEAGPSNRATDNAD